MSESLGKTTHSDPSVSKALSGRGLTQQEEPLLLRDPRLEHTVTLNDRKTPLAYPVNTYRCSPYCSFLKTSFYANISGAGFSQGRSTVRNSIGSGSFNFLAAAFPRASRKSLFSPRATSGINKSKAAARSLSAIYKRAGARAGGPVPSRVLASFARLKCSPRTPRHACS